MKKLNLMLGGGQLMSREEMKKISGGIDCYLGCAHITNPCGWLNNAVNGWASCYDDGIGGGGSCACFCGAYDADTGAPIAGGWTGYCSAW